MNTIFIDVNDLENKIKKDAHIFMKLKNKFIKISMIRDFTNDKFNKNIFLQIDQNFLDSVLKNKHKLNEKVIQILLKKEYKKDKKLFVVFSKKIDKNKEYKKYLQKLIDDTLKAYLKITYITTTNDMLKRDTIYVDNILKKANINTNKASILIAINNVRDFKQEKMIEYIQKYKYVDILRLNSISKREYKSLAEKIDSINDEYGTTIEIVQRRNISEYDVYVFYSDIDVSQFRDHYILNRNIKILDTKNEEQDTLSLSFRNYNKNKYEIEALFNRINCDLKRFSKNKLGNLFTNKNE
ncbi:MAG: hypothetical protein Q4D02_02100 [Clostridia bacterium]|nr:hypothetical protein [Clostridia bacterium]